MLGTPRVGGFVTVGTVGRGAALTTLQTSVSAFSGFLHSSWSSRIPCTVESTLRHSGLLMSPLAMQASTSLTILVGSMSVGSRVGVGSDGRIVGSVGSAVGSDGRGTVGTTSDRSTSSWIDRLV